MARKGDALYLRGKSWYLDFRHDGQRHVVRLGRNITWSVAKELAVVKRGKILKGEEGIGRKKKDISFEMAKEEFVRWAKANKRVRTLRTYRQCLDHLEHSFSGKRLSQISPIDIERHKRKRIESGAKVRPNRELAVLKMLFNRCNEWGMFEGENPVMAVKYLKEPKRRLRYLEPHEEARLIEKCPEPLRSLIIIGINTGLRIRAEALTLKWTDVDLPQRLLTVQAAYAKNGQTRHVMLNSRAIEVLKSLKAESKGEYVFSKVNGAPYKGLDKPFTKALQAAKLVDTGISLHTLRHTFASRLVMAGVDLPTVMELGGWSDLSMVMRYAHLNPQHKRQSVERIAESFHNDSLNVTKTKTIVALA